MYIDFSSRKYIDIDHYRTIGHIRVVPRGLICSKGKFKHLDELIIENGNIKIQAHLIAMEPGNTSLFNISPVIIFNKNMIITHMRTGNVYKIY